MLEDIFHIRTQIAIRILSKFLAIGVQSQPITCMIITIQEMEHYIRTGFGDSDVTISGLDENIPFQGILQGNGSGPVLWLAVSTPLIEMMQTRGHGIQYRTSISLEKDDLIGFGFVDDTDLVEGNLNSATLNLEDVFINMQK